MARLLFVHAHPDDETLTCGITMAHHVAAGDDVHVLTCTLGEEGEVIPPELGFLQGAEGDPLGPYRREELLEATRRLGVEVAVLGQDVGARVLSRYRDSGMAGMPSGHHPGAFAGADVAEAAGLVADHIRALRPDAVVTYDPTGGYRHPDHVQTHLVTMVALASLGDADRPRHAYQIVTPRSWVPEDRAWLREHVPPDLGLTLLPDDAELASSVVDDDQATHVVEDPTVVPTQVLALEAHRTQVRVWDRFYALSNYVAARLPGREAFQQVDPATGALVPTGGVRDGSGLV